MGSFSTSLSGIEAASEDLAVISNNLANMNTTAYKSQQANFEDLFYQLLGTNGAGNAIQVGAGTAISSVTSDLSQGTISSTGVSTNVAVSGEGYFILSDDGTTLYTRAGNFTQDANGYLVTTDGAYVLGYAAVDGVVSSSQTLSKLQILTGQVIPPKATTELELDMNLDASASAPSSATGTLTLTDNASAGETITIGGTTYTFVSGTPSTSTEVAIGSTVADTLTNLATAINAASTDVTATAGSTTLTLSAASSGTTGNEIATTETMANGSFASTTLTGGTDSDSYSTSIVVYDSLGTSHTLTFNFTKTDANTWAYTITIPGTDVGSSDTAVTVSSGTLQFDSDGNLISPSSNVTDITISGLADGASSMSITWDLFNSLGSANLTQVSSDSNVTSTDQDGYASGSLESFTINSDGTIEGSFSNGETLILGQIALATFQNAQGLELAGSNTYKATTTSGTASIGAPDSGGRGSLVGESLEASNVDMTTELSSLIVAERNYQSNARAISTANEMTEYVLSKL